MFLVELVGTVTAYCSNFAARLLEDGVHHEANHCILMHFVFAAA